MAILELSRTWRAAAMAAVVLITSAQAGEKVRFGPSVGVNLQTRPVRSARDAIGFEPSAPVSQISSVSAPMPVPSPGAVVSTRAAGDDEDERNWIFRDGRSAASIQKALGVETFDNEAPTVADHDSVAVIQEYFSRQRSQTRGDLSNGGSRPDLSGALSQKNGLGAAGFSNPISEKSNEAAKGGGADLFGASTFRNTLNSDNLTVRRYFRDLYTTPSSSSADRSAANARNPLTRGASNSRDRSTAFDQLRQDSFSELAGRAAVVNALTPDGPQEDPRLNPAARSLQPVPANNGLPVVNEGNLFERRNGVIEIPGRKF